LLPFTHELFFSFKLPCELLLFCVEQGILEVNFATQDNPQSWLRENTLFTKLFAAYAKYLSFFFFFSSFISVSLKPSLSATLGATPLEEFTSRRH